MKWFGLLLILLISGCNSSTGNSESKLDSIRKSIDTTADRLADSVKSKSEQIEQSIRKKIENGRDSAKKGKLITP